MTTDSVLSLRVALAGIGRMGTAVEAAIERGGRHSVVARFDEVRPLLDVRDPEELHGADVIIDFTAPDVVLDNIHRYCFWGIDAVVGTTGWYDDIPRVAEWVEEGQNGVLYAPNFSLGVAALVRALRGALPLLQQLQEYDPHVHEVHHVGKVDSPSGTALMLADTLIGGLSRKTRVEPETQHGRIDPDVLHVTAARVGSVFGEHSVVLDSPVDQLLFRHVAKGRNAFATGAIRAAEWVTGKTGLFSLDDLLEDWEQRA